MASFSFGAGNAHKLLRLPLYGLGWLVTMLVPRDRGAWVFGCGAGIGDGALALWRVAAGGEHRAIWLVGSERERADAAACGIPTVGRHTLRGFWCTARAGVIVVTHGFGDVNRYAVSGAYVVQLWHGIPLKRIGLDAPETLRVPGALAAPPLLARAVRGVLAVLFRAAARRIALLPAASHLVRARLESAFGLSDERVPVTGEPRVDVLSTADAATRRTAARALVDAVAGPTGDARLVLYAPTWRDGAPDAAVPTAAQWRALVAVLEREDAVLLVRSHPLGAGDYRPPAASDRVRPFGSTLLADVTGALPALAALVTDYSSLSYDAALVPVPVVHLAPDLAEYAASRGFYGTFADVAGDDAVIDWDAATARLARLLGDPAERNRLIERAVALSARVHAHRDGGNTRRVYDAIVAATGRKGSR